MCCFRIPKKWRQFPSRLFGLKLLGNQTSSDYCSLYFNHVTILEPSSFLSGLEPIESLYVKMRVC